MDIYNLDNMYEGLQISSFGLCRILVEFRYHFGAFRSQGHADAPNGKHFGSKAAQMLQMISLGNYHFGDYFGANAAQMHQTISFGTSLNPFGLKAAQIVQMVISFVTILNHLLSDGSL